MKYTYDSGNIHNAVRSALFAGALLLGIAGLVYSPLGMARDDSSMSGQSGQSGSMSGQSSSGQKGGMAGQKGHQKKQEGATSSGQGSTGSGREVTEEMRTGVTGDTPSGGRSETTGQQRGPSGY